MPCSCLQDEAEPDEKTKMESKIRHDLRHPLATISMIASTITAFGDAIEEETIEVYRKQVVAERDELKRLAGAHGVSLPLTELDQLVGSFSSDPTPKIAQSLDEACHQLISKLSSGRFE